jgi:hypothetical protein
MDDSSPAPVRLAATNDRPTSRAAPHDLGLLVLLLGTHLVPVVAALAGASVPPAATGFATAVLVLAARELVHEVASAARAR